MSMKRRASRFGLLFIGVFIGILAGILLAFWFNNNGWKLSFIKNIFSGEKENRTRVQYSEPEKTESQITRKPDTKTYRRTQTHAHDSSGLNTVKYFAENMDGNPDSVLINTFHRTTENIARDLVVIKDELMFSRLVKVVGVSEDPQESDLDSVLLDDRGYKRSKTKMVQVEFWKSPVNFRGYKWDTRKLLLFGFYDYEYIYIKYLNDNYYMQYGTLYYLLEPSDTFSSMSMITDEPLIKELNSL
jgi:hypothetical protein